MAPTATAPATLGELRPILELVPSPLNPRRHFDKQKLEELAASIASKGIIEPLIVRERPGFGQLEIVAGERRYRAAKIAKHELVPVIIRHLSDVEVLELMAIENSQRDDLHPLEEAAGYDALMKADRAYTPEAIAAKIGKSKRYVQQRLQLARLEPAVKKAFLEDKITAGHADLLSRLKPDDQAAALKACFQHLFDDDTCISVRRLNQWIENNIRIELTPEDPQLAFLPEVTEALASPAAATILQVASAYIPPSQKTEVLKTALPNTAWREVTSKGGRCKYAQRAVIVIGGDRGKLIDVCTAKTECTKHWKWEIEQAARDAKEKKAKTSGSRHTASPKVAAAEKKAREQRAAAQARREVRDHVLDQVAKRFEKIAPTKPSPALLPLLAEAIPQYLTGKSATTWKGLAITALAVVRQDCFGDQEFKALAKLLKPLGLDVLAIEKDLAPKAEAQTAAPKKAGKK